MSNDEQHLKQLRIAAASTRLDVSTWDSHDQVGQPGSCYRAQVFDGDGNALFHVKSDENAARASDHAKYIAACNPTTIRYLLERHGDWRRQAQYETMVAQALEDDLKTLLTKYNALREEYGQLQADNADLSASNAAYKRQITSLVDVIADLRNGDTNS